MQYVKVEHSLTQSNYSCSKGKFTCDSGDGGLKDFWIPDYILLSKSKVKKRSHIPACPVIVFVNSRSGGQLGGELLVSYRTLLNKNQVTFFGCTE